MPKQFDVKPFSVEQSMFSGGAAPITDPRLLELNQVQRIVNGYPARSGRIRKRRGYVEAVASQGAYPVQGVRRLVTEWGQELVLVWTNGKLYMTLDGVTTEKDSGLSTTAKIAHEQWGNTVYYSDGVHGLRSLAVPQFSLESRGSTMAADGISSVKFTAKTAGAAGNAITVTLRRTDPSTVGQWTNKQVDGEQFNADFSSLRVSVVGNAVYVDLPIARLQTSYSQAFWFDDAGLTVPTTPFYRYFAAKVTIQQIIDAIAATPAAAALVVASSGNPTAEFQKQALDSSVALEHGDPAPAGYDAALGDHAIYSADVDMYFIAARIPTVTIQLKGGTDAQVPIQMVENADVSFVYLARRAASERLFGIDAADETNLRYCQPFDATLWPADNVISPGGRFMAAIEVGSTFVPLTEEMLYRIDGTDPETWKVEPIPSSGLGCVARFGVQEVEGVVVYPTPRGVAFFDGSKPKLLSSSQYDSRRPDRSLFTITADSFAVQTGDHYCIFTPGANNTTAAVFDFSPEMMCWGGEYVFGFKALCGMASLAGDLDYRVPFLGLSDGRVAREDADTCTDFGDNYTWRVVGRELDAARPLTDKKYNEMRAAFYSPGEASVTVRMLFEDDTQPRAEATVTETIPAGHTTVVKRIQNARAKVAHLEVESTSPEPLELVAFGGDLFFP